MPQVRKRSRSPQEHTDSASSTDEDTSGKQARTEADPNDHGEDSEHGLSDDQADADPSADATTDPFDPSYELADPVESDLTSTFCTHHKHKCKFRSSFYEITSVLSPGEG